MVIRKGAIKELDNEKKDSISFLYNNIKSKYFFLNYYSL